MITYIVKRRKDFFEYERKKGHIKVTSDITPTTVNYLDNLSTSSHSKVIIHQDRKCFSVAMDIEKNKKENIYFARRLVVCHPVETEDEFQTIFSHKKIKKVNLSTKVAEGMLSNGLVLKDGTKICKDWTIEFTKPKSYEDSERFISILLKFIEIINGSELNIKILLYHTEESCKIEHIFPKPVFKHLSVPHRKEILSLFDSEYLKEYEDSEKIVVILGFWMNFFLENAQHAFLESMSNVMGPYEHKNKNNIIAERVDFLASMFRIVAPGENESTGKILRKLLNRSTEETKKKYKYPKEDIIIENCKNLRNLIIHKIKDENRPTDVSHVDYDIFETYFFKNFFYLMIEFSKSQEKGILRQA